MRGLKLDAAWIAKHGVRVRGGQAIALTYACLSDTHGRMKRTTLVLEDGLLEGIRREAQRRECGVSQVVNEYLRAGLHRKRDSGGAGERLPAFPMGRPRADLADRDAFENLMESA